MITIECGHIKLQLNGEALSIEEQQYIRNVMESSGETEERINEVITEEVKMRSIHAQIIALGEFDLISEMVQADPNGWFIDYCNLRQIEI